MLFQVIRGYYKKNKRNITVLYFILFLFFLFNNYIFASADQFILKYNINEIKEPEYRLKNEYSQLYLPEFHVRGIYVTGWVAGTDKRMCELIDLVDDTILNTMVIDIKDQQGYISYRSNVALANEIKANRRKISDIKGLLNKLHNQGIYTIARIVVFKDALLAGHRPDLVMQLWDSNNEEITTNSLWVDPSKKEVWDYNIDLAREAINLGFDEIQFDYVRCPALASSPYEVIFEDNQIKSDVIKQFILYARKQLADTLAPISIDVFGLTTTVDNDLGIGQNFADLCEVLDVISPMIYPSHYAPGSFGIKVPENNPYNVVYKSMLDAQKKVTQKNNIILRPWLQDFSLKYKYTSQDVKDQIKALNRLGIKEWLLWNPRSRYTKKALINPPIN